MTAIGRIEFSKKCWDPKEWPESIQLKNPAEAKKAAHFFNECLEELRKEERERAARICEKVSFDRSLECPNCETGNKLLRYAAQKIRGIEKALEGNEKTTTKR